MKQIWGVLAAGAVLAIAQPALADVKAGVDAWQQGDYDKAVAEWQPLAQAGDPDAQFNMGQAYKLGRGVKADLPKALDWYRKAATQGHVRAEDNLGLLMFQQGDRAGAFPYLQRSATRGEPRAQYIVGTALFNGDIAPKNWVRAYALMTRASGAGLAQATASLKQMDRYIPADQREQGVAMAREMGEKAIALDDGDGRPNMAPPVRDARPDPTPVPMPKAAADKETPAKPAPAKVAAAAPMPKAKPEAKAEAKAEARKPEAKAPAAKAASAKPAAPRPAANGGWRVQLGAFSEESRARALWNQLSGKVSGLSSYQLFLVKGGGMTKLQAGPLASNADAARLCGAIKAAGAVCIPRKM